MMRLKSYRFSDSSMSVLNLSCIVMSIIILGGFCFFRKSFEQYYSIQDIASLFALSVILIVTPSFCQRCFAYKSWYTTEAFFYFLLIILLIALYNLANLLGLIAGFQYLLYLVASLEVLLEFLILTRNKICIEYLFIPLGLSVMALVVYSDGTQSLFLYEKLILGDAHQDPVFHMALSNIIKSTGIPSLGLDGALPIKYHWFSHYFFSVLSSLTNTSSLLFYNVGVLVVLGPLFFKSFYSLANAISVYRKKADVDVYFFISILFIAQSFMNSDFWSGFTPFESESYGFSLTLMAFFLSSLLSYLTYSKDKKKYLFYLYVVIVTLIILFTKVSTGMVLIAGLFLLLVLNHNLIGIIKGVLIITILGATVAFYIIELNKTFVIVSPFTRVARVIKSSDGLILYASGLILFLYYWYKNKFSILKTFLKSLNSIYGFLLAMTVTGLVLAFYLAYNTSDPFYFGSVQFLFSFVLFISLAYSAWSNWNIDVGFKKWALVILFIMSIGAHFDTYVKIQIDKQDVITQLSDKDVNAQVVVRILLKLNETEKKESMVLYLDDDIKSLISAGNIYSSTFAPSALSGIPSVGGISSELGSLKGLNYGLNDYYKSDYLFINSIDQAILRAEQIGKKELIHLFLDHEKQVTFEIITL